ARTSSRTGACPRRRTSRDSAPSRVPSSTWGSCAVSSSSSAAPPRPSSLVEAAAAWRRLRSWTPLLVVAVSGCSLLFDYPAATPEEGAERCADGVDDDLDGLVDCEDPDCDGHCPEERLQACTNGRDDDGDGFVDLHDPRCWPWADFVVEDCASVEG